MNDQNKFVRFTEFRYVYTSCKILWQYERTICTTDSQYFFFFSKINFDARNTYCEKDNGHSNKRGVWRLTWGTLHMIARHLSLVSSPLAHEEEMAKGYFRREYHSSANCSKISPSCMFPLCVFILYSTSYRTMICLICYDSFSHNSHDCECISTNEESITVTITITETVDSNPMIVTCLLLLHSKADSIPTWRNIP